MKRVFCCGNTGVVINIMHVVSCFHYRKSTTVLGSLLFKSNSLHITLYFEDNLCITVTYYLETKVTIIYLVIVTYYLEIK